jgi:hypothetical protein
MACQGERLGIDMGVVAKIPLERGDLLAALEVAMCTSQQDRRRHEHASGFDTISCLEYALKELDFASSYLAGDDETKYRLMEDHSPLNFLTAMFDALMRYSLFFSEQAVYRSVAAAILRLPRSDDPQDALTRVRRQLEGALEDVHTMADGKTTTHVMNAIASGLLAMRAEML